MPNCSNKLSVRTLVIVFFTLCLMVVIHISLTTSLKSFLNIDVAVRILKNLSNIRKLSKSGTLKENVSDTLALQTDRQWNVSNVDLLPVLDKVSTSHPHEEVTIMDNHHRSINIIKSSNSASTTKRKDECNNCFTHNFKYVIDNTDICNLYSGQIEIELLILILTAHSNVQQRNALRETWLTHTKNNTANVRYAFLLGEVKDTKLKEDIAKESGVYNDIIKEDFVDVYSNLTYKTIMGFKWAATKCGVTKAVLKTDDDMYINVPNVLNIVRNNFTSLQTSIVGSCKNGEGPIRNPTSKWFASINSYPGKLYPGVCSGTGYLTSLNVVRKVLEISPQVPFFHLEDVYVALCIQKLGYHAKSFPGFNRLRPELDACLFNGKWLVTAHNMTPAMIRQMWNDK